LTKLILRNDRGISVLFLIIAMLLMVTITYVLSYLIPTKHKSVRFPIYSQQAFYIAQSGVEFAIRYASDRGWRGMTEGGTYDLNRLNAISRSLGNGALTIGYNNAIGDILTSTGQITGSSERRVVRVSNFTSFLRLVFDSASPEPCWCQGKRGLSFVIRNVSGSNLILTSFSATWSQAGPARFITEIHMDGVQKYAGSYSNGGAPVVFNLPVGSPTQTITPGQSITIFFYWNQNIANVANNLITFYTGAGKSYTFNLDPAGDGLPTCPVPC
jgi:hypothetical protein